MSSALLPTDRLIFSGAAVLALLAVGAQGPIFDRNFVSMDEGHLALAASRLLAGDVLYRDIHTGIFPVMYATTAGLFALFGEELLVTRIAQIAVNAASVLLLWFIGLRIMPPRWAALPPVLHVALVWISFPVLTMFNYSALAGALGLGALLAAIRFLERGRGVDALAIGLLVGCCLFTKQNYGGLAAVAIAIGILLGRPRSALRETSLALAFAPIVASGTAFLALAIGQAVGVGGEGGEHAALMHPGTGAGKEMTAIRDPYRGAQSPPALMAEATHRLPQHALGGCLSFPQSR